MGVGVSVLPVLPKREAGARLARMIMCKNIES